MNARPTSHIWKLPPYERACARLEHIARYDTINGGARAMVLAGRASRKRFPARDIVSDVYGASTGKASETWGAWRCDECGSVFLGRDAAAECCNAGE